MFFLLLCHFHEPQRLLFGQFLVVDGGLVFGIVKNVPDVHLFEDNMVKTEFRA